MKKHLVAVAVALSSLHAAAATYSFASGPYIATADFTAPCALGSCANFPAGTQQQGTFVTAADLAPNLAAADITAQVTSYAFSDGLTVYGSGDAQSRLFFMRVSTDAAGNLTGFQLRMQRWQAPGVHAAGDRFDTFDANAGGGTSQHNLGCNLVGVSSGGTADTCNTPVADTNGSSGFHVTAILPALVPAGGAVAAIPTLGEWGLLLTVLALATSGLWMARHR